MSAHVSDKQRDQLAAGIALGLAGIYRAKRRQSLRRLQSDASDAVPADAQKRIQSFAAERAQLVQTGINQRLDGADDPAQAKQEIRRYNAQTLIPFLVSFASHAGTIDTYASTSLPGQNGPARDAVTWTWTQMSDCQDVCAAADEASPALYGTLVDIAGGPPPRHPNCACGLSPTF